MDFQGGKEAGSSGQQQLSQRHSGASGGSGSVSSKRKSAWYQMLNPTYRSRCEDFKRIFKDLPMDERLIVDYSCALQRDILLQGRIYVTQNYLCFYANIFRWETLVRRLIKNLNFPFSKKDSFSLLLLIFAGSITLEGGFVGDKREDGPRYPECDSSLHRIVGETFFLLIWSS